MTLAALCLGLTLIQVPVPKIVDSEIGKGMVAEMGDAVNLGFRCTFLDGKILDSTFGKAPFCIKLGWRPRLDGFARLPFPALDASISGMKEGGKRTIVLPSSLAYGPLEVGDVPANTDLTFEVELYNVVKKGSAPPIKIEELKVGTGAEIVSGKPAIVHYKGYFLNEIVFDGSFRELDEKGEPVGDPITIQYEKQPLIKGFDQGLKGMKVGGARRVTIPYALAYGEKGRQEIPPFATLVFELRLMGVN